MRSFILWAGTALCLALTTAASAQTTFAYTANTLNRPISIYKLNTLTGALTQTGGSPFASDTPAYLAAARGNKFLVVSGGQCPGCGVQTFAINPSTGALTLS